MQRLVALPLLALLACGPNPKPPVKVMALLPSESGAFTTTQVELTTLSDATALKGSVAELLGGARVVVDPNDPLQNLNGGIQNQTDQQRYEVLVKDKGLDVRANYTERAGVLWPADFHTWNMVTTYYNFERSYLYWLDVYNGVDPKELQKMRVMYWPEVRLNSATPLTDNALFLSFVKSFVIVPFKDQQLVPLAMNIGVIGHEVAHKVFNYKVLGDAGIHPALTSWNAQPFNLLKSLDEGLADFHGFSVTCLEAAGCRPAYLGVSITDARTVEQRNVARTDACLDSNTREAFRQFNPDQWVRAPEMYLVGNLFAASIYQAANKVGGDPKVMQRVLLAAYDDDSTTTPGLRQLLNKNLNTPQNFTVEAVANTIVAHASDPKLKMELCNEFSTRLQTTCGVFGGGTCPEMPDCPATAGRKNFCTVLPQP